MTPISAIASLPGTEPPANRSTQPAQPGEERDLWDRIWGKEGFSFGALLDIINPLQHIPVVSTIYRSVSGDTIGPGPRMAGGAIFGGVVGLIASAADAAVEAVTGKDTGSHVMAMLPEPDPTPQWAADERRGQRPQMAGLMNLPDGGLQYAEADEQATGRSPSTSPEETEAGPAPIADAAEPSEPEQPKPGQLAGPVHPQATAQAVAPPPRTARLGAGGRLVPLATQGRTTGATPAHLPSAQSVAADPSLLRELRQGGAAAANATAKAPGRIDTAIKGHGLIAPSGPTAAASWRESATTDRKASALDGDAPGDKPAPIKASPDAAASIPEVGPDFLMKMQRALDKYQAMRHSAPPNVDLSR